MDYPNMPTGITVTALIVKNKKEVLLGRRTIEPCRGKWSLLGGFVNSGESLEVALNREISEETSGCEITKRKYLFSMPQKYGSERQVLTAVFICKIKGKPERSDEIDKFQWISKGKVPSLAFSSGKRAVSMFFNSSVAH